MGWKAFFVSLDGLNQNFGRDFIQGGKIRVENNLDSADGLYAIADVCRRNFRLSLSCAHGYSDFSTHTCVRFTTVSTDFSIPHTESHSVGPW